MGNTGSLALFTLGFTMRFGHMKRQVDIRDSLRLTPVSTMRLQGVQLITCVQILLLPVSLPLEGQTALCSDISLLPGKCQTCLARAS